MKRIWSYERWYRYFRRRGLSTKRARVRAITEFASKVYQELDSREKTAFHRQLRTGMQIDGYRWAIQEYERGS